MPISPKYRKVLEAMIAKYGEKKGTSIFYATMNKKGIDYTKEFKFSSGFEHKEENGEYFVQGFIATSHPDKVGDIIPLSTLQSLEKQINIHKFEDVNAASMHHDRNDVNLIGLGTRTEIRQTEDGHHGLWVETQLNKMHPDFEKTKYEIENGFVTGHSIEFITKNAIPLKEGGRVLNDIELHGFGYASPRTIINPNAVITGYGEKELSYKEMISFKEKAELGNGERFEALVKKLMASKGISRERAEKLAAYVGRKKYGKEKFQKLSAQGKEIPDDIFDDVSDDEIRECEEELKMIDSKEEIEQKELIELRAFKEEALKKTEIEQKEKEQKELIKTIVKEMIPEIKPMLVVGQGMPVETKEFKEWKEILSNDKLSLKEQFKRAGAYAESCGAFRRMTTPIFERKEKSWTIGDSGMEFKALETTTNRTADTDYYQSAAELNDIYDPVIYNVLNDRTTTYGLLQKKDFSAYQQIQVRVRDVRNTSAGPYSEGGAITKGNTTRIKLQQPFKYYKVGVQVTGQMIASAAKGGIGDVFNQEVEDASKDLLHDINYDLTNSSGGAYTAQKGALTDEELMSMEYVTDSTQNTTLYGLTRSSYTFMATGGDDAMSSAQVNKTQLRKMIRTVESNGANRASLLFITSPTQRDMILGQLDDAQRFNAVSARAGFEGLPTFDGVPIQADPDCNSDHIFLIPTDEYWIGIQVAPTYEDLAKTDDSRSGFIKCYLNTMCLAPYHCYQADGFATS